LPERRALVSGGSLLVLFIVVYSLIHLLSWALTRYRLPVDTVGLVFAGRALAEGAQRLLHFWRSPKADGTLIGHAH
jgi:hypothetical protein